MIPEKYRHNLVCITSYADISCSAVDVETGASNSPMQLKRLPVENLDFVEIGGIGEMIYRAVRFPEYILNYDDDEEYKARILENYNDHLFQVIDMFPDFRMRLKLDKKTSKVMS